LDEAWIVDGGVEGTEPQSVNVIDRRTILRVIEEVEELRAKVQAHFAMQAKVLDDRKIGVHEIGSGDRDTGGVAEFACDRCGEASGVEELMVGVAATMRVATGELVWPVEVVGVAA